MSAEPHEAHDWNPEFFVPKHGQTQWWTGDPEQLPLAKLSEENPSLVMRQNTLSTEQCQTLIDCFDRQREEFAAQTGSAFWDGRYIWQDKIPRTEIDALRIMQQARLVAHLTILQEFQPQQPLYSDTAQIVLWTGGIELTPHADNLEPDGSPNTTPHRSYSSLNPQHPVEVSSELATLRKQWHEPARPHTANEFATRYRSDHKENRVGF